MKVTHTYSQYVACNVNSSFILLPGCTYTAKRLSIVSGLKQRSHNTEYDLGAKVKVKYSKKVIIV